EVEVEKPASLSEGPASDPVPGRFPLKETLSGFLPYVWGHMFGGIWQDVWLEARSQITVVDAHIRGSADGSFSAEVQLSEAAPVRLEVISPSGDVEAHVGGSGRELRLAGGVPGVQPWDPDAPALYEARLTVDGELV